MDRAPEDWIGRQESCVDALDTSLASCIAAMLARPFPQEGEVLPPALALGVFSDPGTSFWYRAGRSYSARRVFAKV